MIKLKGEEKRRNFYGILFVLVPVFLVIVFSFIPMLQSFMLSFQTGKGVNLSFGGLVNYKRLFHDPVFIQSLKNTLLFLVLQVPLMMVLALIFATLLNDKKLKGRSFFRICIFLPCVTSLVACSVLFKSIFTTDGIINIILLNLNLIQQPIEWLLDPMWAKITIIIVLTWRWTGYDMIFYIASMQNIDSSIYEAASIDGASSIKQFFHITIPQLKPIIVLTAIMSTNGTLQLFDEVVNLTSGGPNNATMTISKYIYDLSFKYAPNFPYAATTSYAILFFVAVLSFIQFRATRSKD